MAQGTRPQNAREFMSKLVVPYTKTNGTPNKIYSEPKQAGMPEINRAYQIASDSQDDKDFNIGIKEIDEAVMHYFKNTLRLSVVQNNTSVQVPVIYGTPENWKSFQRDGYYRDKEGRLMAPLLVFKRDDVAQNRNLGYKLDGNLIHNLQYFKKSYSKRNFYNNFGVLNNRVPQTEYAVAMTPDYVTVEYSCVIWTYFMEQMDKLIEAINYSARSYWGDPERFQFYSNIERFTDTTEYSQGEDRAVRTSFTLSINGYLIPDSINKKIANASKVFGLSRLIFGIEATNSDLELFTTSGKSSQKKPLAGVIAADSTNTVIQNTTIVGGVTTDTTLYLNTNVTKNADAVTAPNTATITGASFLQPPMDSGLPPTSVDNFTFFVNGQYIPNSIVAIVESSGDVVVTFNTVQLGYELETDDEVTVIGKFS